MLYMYTLTQPITLTYLINGLGDGISRIGGLRDGQILLELFSARRDDGSHGQGVLQLAQGEAAQTGGDLQVLLVLNLGAL